MQDSEEPALVAPTYLGSAIKVLIASLDASNNAA
jgi:hypothetical protein